MKVNVPAGELTRIARVVGKCIDPKIEGRNSNVELQHKNGVFSVSASNGAQHIRMCTEADGGDGETVCVDGKMFEGVAGKCSGNVTIRAENTVCTIQAGGRTRLPLVDTSISKPGKVSGEKISIKADDLVRAVGNVMYAVASDDARLVLTGILMNADGGEMNLVAIDGFEMSKETVECEGGKIHAIVPGVALKRFCDGVLSGETVYITANENKIALQTDSIQTVCSLLHGEYLAWKKLVPESFITEVAFRKNTMMEALRGSSVVESSKNLVRFKIENDSIKISSNSERADYSAEIEAENVGDELEIAFNTKYVMAALNALDADEVVMKATTPYSAVVFSSKGGDEVRLLLPVRVVS